MNEYPWFNLARKDVGIREIPGSKDNPKVLQYYKDAGHPEIVDDEVSWCAAFVGAMLHRCGYKNTQSLLARSYLKYGLTLQAPSKGCIVVFKRGSSTWQGHVTFFSHWARKDVLACLGGNQADGVNVSYYHVSNVLGYRWPVK
jgi:uncharacterized protein (TIGR02594 family)